jgi:hypothetical protein
MRKPRKNYTPPEKTAALWNDSSEDSTILSAKRWQARALASLGEIRVHPAGGTAVVGRGGTMPPCLSVRDWCEGDKIGATRQTFITLSPDPRNSNSR